MRPLQPSASAGLAVTISHSSTSVNALPRPPEARFHRSATFSSPSRCLDPDGAQSAPRHTRMPCVRAATTSLVWRYSHRFDNGDHTIELPCGPQSAYSGSPSAVAWMATSLGCRRVHHPAGVDPWGGAEAFGGTLARALHRGDAAVVVDVDAAGGHHRPARVHGRDLALEHQCHAPPFRVFAGIVTQSSGQ
jgi:hypothetical protein